MRRLPGARLKHLGYMQIKVHADYTTENIGTPSLELTFVAASSGAQAGVVNTADCRSTPWELLYKVGAGEGSTRYGESVRVELCGAFLKGS